MHLKKEEIYKLQNSANQYMNDIIEGSFLIQLSGQRSSLATNPEQDMTSKKGTTLEGKDT